MNMKRSLLIGAMTTATLLVAVPAAAESTVLRAECRKNDDRGCSANSTVV